MSAVKSGLVEAARVYLEFMHIAERLKFVLRHDWTSSGRQESVAEHSWRLALMVMLSVPQLEFSIDCEKALKMALIHDIAEAITGDIPYFEAPENSPARTMKIEHEKVAIDQIKSKVQALGDDWVTIWNEFEEGESVEAKLVIALDKLESSIQQCEAGISTWSDAEKQDVFTERLRKYCEHDAFLLELQAQIIKISRNMVKE